MKTEILDIVGTWRDIMNACRSTVRKKFKEDDPSEAFKRGIIMAEHSPIRLMSIRFRWKDIPSWVATHFSRHKWECFISTQRTDRTGVNRDELPQNAPVVFMGDANVQNLIDTSRKRLCHMAAKETREYWEDFVEALAEKQPIIAEHCVPNCVYRGGCPEMGGCGMWKRFMAYASSVYKGELWEMTLQERYQLYTEWKKNGGE